VPIAVHRDLDRGVAESGLDGLGVFTFCDEPRGVGVTQIVYSAWRPDGFCDGSTQVLPNVPRRKNPPASVVQTVELGGG
jgi:hypothetical protein